MLKEKPCHMGAGTTETLQPARKVFPQWLEPAGTGRGSSSTVPCRNPNTRTFLSFVFSFPIFCLGSHSPRSLHLLLLLLPPPLPQEAVSAGIQRFALLSLPDPPSQGLLCGPADMRLPGKIGSEITWWGASSSN